MNIDRLAWREKTSRRYNLSNTLSFRAARFLELYCETPEDAKKWLCRLQTRNVKGLGAKTYTELLEAFNMSVAASAPRTIGAKLRAAEARIAELEQIIHDLRIENSGQAAEIEKLKEGVQA